MPSATDITAIALPVVVGFALIGLAILVIRNGGGHRHNVFFATLYILSGIKSFSEGVDQVADSFNAQAPLFPPEFFWTLMAGFCALGMLPLLFLFSASFPRPVKWMTQRPKLALLAAVPSAGMAALLTGALLDPNVAPLFLDAVPIFNLLGVVLSVVVLVLLVRTRRSSTDHVERTQALYVAFGFLPGFLAGWSITAIQFLHDGGWVASVDAEEATLNIIHFLSPLGELFAAGLVGFAILKYNILGIKPGFRVGVKSFLVGFIFAVVFLTTQFIENVVLQGQLFNFAGDYGSFILSGVTGIVLFKPIEKVSSKVSNRLLPQDKDPTGVDSRAADIYRSQCSHILRDAQVTPREMALLRSLREQLGLTETQARAIEEQVERRLHVDAPETGASPGTATPHVLAAHAAMADEAVEVVRASPLPVSAPRPAPRAASPSAKPSTAKGASKKATSAAPKSTSAKPKAAAPKAASKAPAGKPKQATKSAKLPKKAPARGKA